MASQLLYTAVKFSRAQTGRVFSTRIGANTALAELVSESGPFSWTSVSRNLVGVKGTVFVMTGSFLAGR